MLDQDLSQLPHTKFNACQPGTHPVGHSMVLALPNRL